MDLALVCSFVSCGLIFPCIWSTFSPGSLRITVTCFFLAIPRILGGMFSITGLVATALLAGSRGFARLEGTPGFATRLAPISDPAETSADFGGVSFMGTPSLTVGTRFGRVGGSGFCAVLCLSAWVIMPGTLGFEDFGANAIAKWLWSEVSGSAVYIQSKAL